MIYFQIFVVSCVVYASKFKPIGPEAITGLGPAMPLQPIGDTGKIQVAGLIGTSLGIGRDNRKPPRESTTNAHDWVWLGNFLKIYLHVIGTPYILF